MILMLRERTWECIHRCIWKLNKGERMSTEEKRKLIEDYMSKCPFIEFHSVVDLNGETATVDIAFDEESEGYQT